VAAPINNLLHATADQIAQSKRLCIAGRRSQAETAEVIRISHEVMTQSKALLRGRVVKPNRELQDERDNFSL
jgi:hypothetical protein